MVAAVMAAVAGCGSSSVADPSSPVPITSTSQTSSSSPTAPTISVSASPSLDPNSDAAIIAAVEAYVSAYQAAVRLASVKPYLLVTTAACNCRVGIQSLISQLAARHAHTDIALSVNDPRIIGKSKDGAEVQFDLVNAAYHVFDAAGRIIAVAPKAHVSRTVNMRLTGSRWLVYLTS